MPDIYLDYAAATPLDERVEEAMRPYFRERFYNPSSLYLASRQVAADLNATRAEIAGIVGSKTSEIVFTAGGTEANNLAVQGVLEAFPGCHVLASAIEHESMLEPVKKYHHDLLRVNPDGLVDINDLPRKITDKTVLVSIMYANNEIGSIQPVSRISAVIKDVVAKRKKSGNTLPLYLHTDACQAGAYLDLHVSRLGVDLMTLNAGKIYGPKQCGLLFIKSGVKVSPQVLGGGQEFGKRSGTENVAGVIGFAEALKIAQDSRKSESKRLKNLQKIFISELNSRIPGIRINGSLRQRLPNNVHITIPGQDNERLVMELDRAGVQCAVGSACSASNDEPSHVLKAIGLTDSEAQASLRFAMGKGSDERSLIYVAEELERIVKNKPF